MRDQGAISGNPSTSLLDLARTFRASASRESTGFMGIFGARVDRGSAAKRGHQPRPHVPRARKPRPHVPLNLCSGDIMKLLKIPVLCALFVWSFRAIAQTAPLDPVASLAPLVMDPTSALMVSLLDSGGLPVVCGFIAWKLSGAVNGWTPTIRVIHENDARPWDGVDRRASPASDR